MKNIIKRQNEWIGYILRHGEWLRLAFEGMIKGNIRRSRPPSLQYIDQLMENQEFNSYQKIKNANYRETTAERLKNLYQKHNKCCF